MASPGPVTKLGDIPDWFDAPMNTTQADEIVRLIGLGAVELAGDQGQPWVVLADPEDNELCVLPPRA